MDLEALVWDLAERQHGLVGRRQLLAQGFADRDVEALDRRGALEHLSAEVFRLRGACLSDHGRAMAAVLDSPHGAVVSHGSAAAIWGVPGFDLRGPLHVTIPRQGTRKRSRLAVVHYQKDLPLNETVIHQGIPVTTPTLLAFHLAACERHARAERAYDYLLARHLTSAQRLDGLIARIGGSGRNGTRVARELVKMASDAPRPESGLERRVDWLARRSGLKVRRQVVLGDDQMVGRVDFDIVDRPGVIEAQSLTYHSSPMSAASDGERIRRLLDMGRSVMAIWDYQAFQHGDHVIQHMVEFGQRIDAGEPPFYLECPDPDD